MRMGGWASQLFVLCEEKKDICIKIFFYGLPCLCQSNFLFFLQV